MSIPLIPVNNPYISKNTPYLLPLQKIPSGISEVVINVTIENTSYSFYFQNNVIEDNLFLSVYGFNQSPIYFGSYRCIFGTYINYIDAGLPYLIYFINTTQIEYSTITFDGLNNGVAMYAVAR